MPQIVPIMPSAYPEITLLPYRHYLFQHLSLVHLALRMLTIDIAETAWLCIRCGCYFHFKLRFASLQLT